MQKKRLGIWFILILVFLLAGCAGRQTNETDLNSAKLHTVDDLKDKRIGVLLGGIHDTYCQEKYPKATIMQYKSQSDLVLAVKAGKVDAAFYTHETLLDIMREDTELGFLEENLFRTPIAMGFNQKKDELRKEFNTFLKESKENGVYDDMVDRWITKGDTTMPAIDNTKRNGSLVVGIVSDKGMPFAIMKDNKVVGFDIELSERFAAYLGKELVLKDMEFSSLIAAAAGNKIDMIASTLVITEERKKEIDFSDPYYELGASVFALKENIAAQDNNSREKVDLSNPNSTRETAAMEKKSVDSSTVGSFIKELKDSFYNNIILENRYMLIIDGLKTTVIIALFSVLFGTLLGSLICTMNMAKNKVLSTIAEIYISILQGTPIVVLLMLIFYVVFAKVDISPSLVAVIAFGMNFSAYVSKMFRSSIESIDHGQREAGIASGFTAFSTFIYIIMPQAIKRVLPVYKGEFISMFKMTSVVGYIAVQDLTKASDIIRSRTFDAFFPLVMVAVLYFIISWLLGFILDYIDLKTDPRKKRKQEVEA